MKGRRDARHLDAGRAWRLATAAGLALSALAACGPVELDPEYLQLELTADAPNAGVYDEVRLLFRGDDGSLHPADPADPAFNVPLGPGRDPSAGVVRVAVASGGATFPDGRATLHASARVDGVVAAVFVGEVDLGRKGAVAVHLRAVGASCDADADGFLDCDQPGCCGPGDDALADCLPDDPDANPWVIEELCEPCVDEVDNDCDGVDSPCDDADADGVNDCADCDPADPSVGAGLLELCDLKDNDCDGETDEDHQVIEGGEVLQVGASCGLGACAGGTVVCDASGASAVCSTAGEAGGEVCDNGVDDDCDGFTDEGCDLDDRDGDGFGKDDDCDDFDAGVFPGAPEPCCPAIFAGTPAAAGCDRDCDPDNAVFCDAEDLDGDGVTAAQGDCDDADPTVYPGAPERCGDGVDQDCFGGDLACDGLADNDGDGWSPPHDCDDGDAAVRPYATERCDGVDNDCDGQIDEGNPDTGGGRACGSDVGECHLGTTVCVNSADIVGSVRCVDFGQPAPDLCDGLDNDCDGLTDEDFPTYTDRDGTTGLVKGDDCGVGACAGGVVACDAAGAGLTCTTADLATFDLCDGVDNDCDGVVDQDFRGADDGGTGSVRIFDPGVAEPRFLDDACGVGACADGVVVCGGLVGLRCSTAGLASGEVCDGADNDCDGLADEDYVNGAVTIADLDGTGALGKGDACGGGVCGVGEVVCGAAGGLVCSVAGLRGAEVCDGADNDCDGAVDEDYEPGGAVSFTATDGASGLGLGEACGVGACDPEGVAVVACDPVTLGLRCALPTGESVAPAAEVCDGLDNDCDGVVDEDFRAIDDDGLAAVSFTDLDAAGTARYLGQACGQLGACAAAEATVQCGAGGASLVCATAEGAPLQASAEVCDGVDNDCDGAIDEDFKGLGAGGTAEVAFVDYDPAAPPRFLGDDCGRAGVCALREGTVQCDVASGEPVCADGSGAEVAPADEVCNGLDDDCDGFADEEFKALAADGSGLGVAPYQDATAAGGVVERFLGASCGLGECGGGTVSCDVATGQAICAKDGAAVVAGVELCNGLDDDCDGAIDEDFRAAADGGLERVRFDDLDGGVAFLGQACGREGECAPGVGLVACGSGGQAMVCAASVADGGYAVGDAVVARAESCDDRDNDCDGATDEDFGAGGTVTFPDADGDGGFVARVKGDDCGLGACRAEGATVQCAPGGAGLFCAVDVDGAWAPATGGAEVCDGLDNDCDGATDEGLAAVADAAVTGCSVVGACGLPGTVGTCAPADPDRTDANYVCAYGNALYQAGDELGRCDGVDNDCDGETDEDFRAGGAISVIELDGATPRHLGEACGLGACAGGVVVCDPGDAAAIVCTTHAEAADGDATCDDRDDDCNGVVDDAFTVAGAVRYAPLDGSAGLPRGAACGLGACVGGEVVCGGDQASLACSSADLGAAEACDGEDNDCDGEADEGLAVGAGDDVGLAAAGCRTRGVCAGVVTAACDDGAWVCSSATGGVPDFEAVEGRCDALDNDCDGDVDEGLTFVSDGLGASLTRFDEDYGCDVAGVCARAGAVRATCDAAVAGEASWRCDYLDGDWQGGETRCDGLDNDCDGAADEPFVAGAENTTTYTPAGGGGPLFLGDPCGEGACAGGGVVCGADLLSLRCDSDVNATPEVCDGADNDCDGGTDEGTALGLADVPALVAAGCRTAGVCAGAATASCAGAAGYTCAYASADYEAGSESSCDARDNDCDGLTDEALGFVSDGGDDDHALLLALGCAVDGVCGRPDAVAARCAAVTAGVEAWACDYLDPEHEADETRCDDEDNDCDGQIDEGIGVGSFASAAAAQALGCATLGVCADVSATSATCNVGVTPGWSCTYGQANHGAELCDNLDNDCDGATDEELTRDNSVDNTLLAAAGCDVAGPCGELGQSSAVCAAGSWLCSYGSADYEAAPEARCDGLDNDCDGVIDGTGAAAITRTGSVAALAEVGCSVVGVCADVGATEATCAAGDQDEVVDRWICDYTQGAYAASEAGLCDGLDNDCDGATDDGLGVGAACNVGTVCGAGAAQCDPGDPAALICSTDVFAQPIDVCNGLDDDCDGGVDEDAACGAYACGGGAGCFATCADDGDCGAGHGCTAGGACVPTCGGDGDCTGGRTCGGGLCISEFRWVLAAPETVDLVTTSCGSQQAGLVTCEAGVVGDKVFIADDRADVMFKPLGDATLGSTPGGQGVELSGGVNTAQLSYRGRDQCELGALTPDVVVDVYLCVGWE